MDIRNKNELRRRIDAFLHEYTHEEYIINEEFCKDTMRMMADFIGHVNGRMDSERKRLTEARRKLKEALWENKDTKGTNVPSKWIPITEKAPEDESYVLVSFENATMVDIARYEEDDEGGSFYPGDDDEAYSKYGIYVNAWMPLPELYKSEEEKQNEADRRRHAEKVYDG